MMYKAWQALSLTALRKDIRPQKASLHISVTAHCDGLLCWYPPQLSGADMRSFQKAPKSMMNPPCWLRLRHTYAAKHGT